MVARETALLHSPHRGLPIAPRRLHRHLHGVAIDRCRAFDGDAPVLELPVAHEGQLTHLVFHLRELAESDAEVHISAIACYEFCRGPRTPQQSAVARSLFFDDGIVPFSEELASAASEVSRALGSPRGRTADIAIGVTAAEFEAALMTRNPRDFAAIPRLETNAR